MNFEQKQYVAMKRGFEMQASGEMTWGNHMLQHFFLQVFSTLLQTYWHGCSSKGQKAVIGHISI